jgi:SAM-dependent methyltransferase/uncharacterized protein YbaR (Trm112 family)
MRLPMKPRLLAHIVCPMDGQPLELVTFESRAAALSPEASERAQRLGIDVRTLEQEVIAGALVNRRLGVCYPIHDGVPRLLPFRTGVGEAFSDRYRADLAKRLPDCHLPDFDAKPGELEVLRTFSSEWLHYGWDETAYWNLTPEVWFRCMRFVLGLEDNPVNGGLVLEVGIGIGGVADHVSTTEDCEVIGIDLGYAVDAAQRQFGNNPFLHIVQASAFAPPFRSSSFDFVYSFGVIHHTYSTLDAFRSIAKLPKPGGRLYIWVYSPENERRTIVRRVLMVAERAVRPLASRLDERWQSVVLAPFVPLYMTHQALRVLRRGQGQVFYGWREAMHAARDRFTPPYIHRHSDDEVRAWFRDAGYTSLRSTSERERPSFLPIAFTASTGVEGVRTRGRNEEQPCAESLRSSA